MSDDLTTLRRRIDELNASASEQAGAGRALFRAARTGGEQAAVAAGLDLLDRRALVASAARIKRRLVERSSRGG